MPWLKSSGLHRRPCNRRIPARLSFAVVLLLVAVAAPAQEAGEVEARLEAMRARIAEIGAELEADRARHDAETDRLARIEQDLGRLGRSLRETGSSLGRVRSEIGQLEAEAATVRAGLARQQDELAVQLRAAYRLGAQSRIRTLLGEEDPRRIARLMAWHGYLGRARAQSMENLLARLQELDRIGASLVDRRTDLQTLLHSQQQTRDEQAAARDERARAVAALVARIEDSEAELARLRQSAAELEELLEQLADALADIPPDVESPPLDALRGQLEMPVAGPLKARFGDRRSGEVSWTGWLIGARAGTEVRAIAHGRVAYADWLRGYGMMLIIEHGGGYMSLYGHNESLLADVGDWVRPGQTVALVGNSGGEPEPALYFELRRAGQPVNPAGWFR